ncbi:hypothetical protein ABW20_dc0110461 [Dactylellina cionopaga]|nr:hypothetical protein ABW20_dc0110461 [Dactylellina cionopaga]
MATEFKKTDYSVGWICAIPIELAAARAVLDDIHPQLDSTDSDTNIYEFGRIGKHNVVISCLPEGRYGTTQASIVATRMLSSFRRLRFGLMVGVGGGAPNKDNDVRLGDVVVSQPTNLSGGVTQYDFGKAMENGEFKQTGSLNAPPSILLSAISATKATDQAKLGKRLSDTAQEIEKANTSLYYPGQDADRLFRADYNHISSEGRQGDTCKACDASKVVPRPERQYNYPYIHYGIIASGNQVMKDGMKRDRISAQTGALCFEMEAAGLMNDFPCLVIRGICDYSDGHKNKKWQPYAALVAAIYAKELLQQIPTISKHEIEDPERDKIKEINFVIPFRPPFPRNRTFIGRAEELRNIRKYFSDSRSTDTPSIFALTGTGGMGKTQIALEYAYRHHRDFTAVFWMSAASEETIRSSVIDIMQRIAKEQAKALTESTSDYKIISSKLGIPGLIDDRGIVSADPETVGDIRLALLHWLQIPGNSKWLLILDNADDLETFDVQEYFPNYGGGAILVTSRRPEFSYTSEAKKADLEGLDKESAVKLLLRLAQIKDSGEAIENEATTLVKKLGFMPLAISHAGYFMHETKVSLGKYLSYYDEAFMMVQSRKPKVGWNYRNDTAATTWEISFSKIEKEDKEAASLLLVCSYINPEEIFEHLWEDEQSYKLEIKNRILLLASYSLVRIVRFGVFFVHPVVHSWARERQGQKQRFKAIRGAVMVLGNSSQSEETSRKSNKWDAREERMVASHLEHLHRYLKPNFSYFLLHEERRPEIKALLYSIHESAVVLENQGKYDEAMQWYQQALAGKEKALGKDDPDTLITVNNIAEAFSYQGKYDEAMKWHERVLTGKQMVLGKDDPSTLITRALAGKEKALGKDDPSILSTINNIAEVFSYQGKYDEAMQWYKRALAGEEKTLGKDHPSTLSTVSNIGGVFCDQGKYDEAMKCNIAGVLSKQGKYDEAMQWHERVLNGEEKVWARQI